ncbi:His-Xaa-Ser system radical SAM maturase HxsC [Methylophilaceae bacterium]|nr:His-Xaa-Ser system radical SAM maturase HxsC [Methylophilaceae bacterium]
MLKLYGKIDSKNVSLKRWKLFHVTFNPNIPDVLKDKYALIMDSLNYKKGFGSYLSFSEAKKDIPNLFILNNEFQYLNEGDIIRLDDKGRFACIFRVNSRYNTLLLTEQCNHYCLMCSQPPKKQDDSWLLEQALDVIEMIPKNTRWIGFSGGEPTLYGEGFINLLRRTKLSLPEMGVDVLTNGRAFSQEPFTKGIASVDHPNCTFGIPLYSHDPVRHNYVVQAENAFDETINGILNLKAYKQRVEIRIVIHKQTIDHLIETCRYISRNLIFVDHVALMGLEITGFTRANLDKLWVDPYEYKDILSEALAILNHYNIPTSVYNHQLCTVNSDVIFNYQKSISDWKNEFVEECSGCQKKSDCGGFFSSSKKYKYSDNIKAYK